MRIVEPGFPILGFAPSDQAGGDVAAVAATFAERGAITLIAGSGGVLPALTDHPATEPIAMLASFYGMAEALSMVRGMDPDSPPHLAKVTQTL
jgi:glucosamine--fructose-6-phosphate aminotransferase (isomerizing)